MTEASISRQRDDASRSIRKDAATKALYGLTVLLLAWAPFPFASNRPWSWSLLAVMAAVLVAYWGLTVLFIRRPSIYLPKGFLWIALAFGLAWGWAWFQIWGYIPEAFAHQIWSESAAVLSSDSQGRISVNPYATMTSIMRLTTYAFIFWLTMQLTVASHYASRALKAFVIICTSYAIYGLAVQFSGSNLVLWYPKPAYTDVVAGLKYTSELETLALAIPDPEGSSMGKVGRIDHVVLRVFNTVGGSAGPDTSNLDPLQFADEPPVMGAAVVVHSKDKKFGVEGGFRRGQSLIVRQDEPLPFNLLSINVLGSMGQR